MFDNIMLQSLFDKVAVHLLRQGEKSTTNNGSLCAYRGDGGLKCAIGVLLMDYTYSPGMEEELVTTPSVIDALRRSGWPISLIDVTTIELLVALQKAHDKSSPDQWDEKLRQVAKKFRLSTEAIDESCACG